MSESVPTRIVNAFATRDALLVQLAHAFVEKVRLALERDHCCRVLIGGGKTQRDLNAHIVQKAPLNIAWDRVDVYFSDERCVDTSDEDSNFGMNRDSLAIPLGIPLDNVHGIPVQYGADEAARQYADILESLSAEHPENVFHLALLGLGPDGHTASLFPGSPILEVMDRLVAAAGPGPEGLERVTLCYPALNAAAEVWIMAAGQEKRGAINKLLNGPRNPMACPVQAVRPRSDKLAVWIN